MSRTVFVFHYLLPLVAMNMNPIIPILCIVDIKSFPKGIQALQVSRKVFSFLLLQSVCIF